MQPEKGTLLHKLNERNKITVLLTLRNNRDKKTHNREAEKEDQTATQ